MYGRQYFHQSKMRSTTVGMNKGKMPDPKTEVAMPVMLTHRYICGFAFCWTAVVVFSGEVNAQSGPKEPNTNGAHIRAGEEEFHANIGSRRSGEPEWKDLKEDAEFWRSNAQAALADQLKVDQQITMAKNIIFFLGDGMSIPTVTAARILAGETTGEWERESLSWETFPYSAMIKTYPTNSQVADSACSATAYLCGVKGNLGTIGVDVNVNKENCTAMNNPEFQTPSIAKWFQDAGRSSGIVTTMRVTHASPAGAYAHIADRSWEDDHYVADDGWDTEKCSDIAEQLILQDPGKNFKVILGGGRRGFIPNTDYDVEEDHHGYRHDGVNLIDTWMEDKTSKGASAAYVWNRDQLLNTDINNTDYLMGLFAYSHMDYLVERDNTQDPSLPEMTKAAIEMLRKDENGYFLFVEGGLIDHGHHGNKAIKALTETVELAEAVQVALDMTSVEDTLIIVTADHAHTLSVNGYPQRHTDILGYGDTSSVDDLPYTTLLYGNGPGYIEKRYDISNDNFHDVDYRQNSAVPISTSAHAGDDVGLWAVGPHSHLFTGVYEQNYIPHAMAYAACVGDGQTFCDNNN